MDKLEKFILDHKEDFDDPRNQEQGWKNLEKQLHPKKSEWSILWNVAAMFFFMSTAVLMVAKFSDQKVQTTDVRSAGSIEDFFVQIIEYKRNEYSALADKSDSEEFFQDLAELDSAYANLKISFEQLEQEELLEAMLENMQLKVYILNEQIEILRNGDKDNEEVHYSS
ncbi:MAG: hypothetical protein GY816_22010 [Cytophagales bacterium]|nr:hypothetical protein [Cytophagales bacterium]